MLRGDSPYVVGEESWEEKSLRQLCRALCRVAGRGSLIALAFLAPWGMAPLFFLWGPRLGLPTWGPA